MEYTEEELDVMAEKIRRMPAIAAVKKHNKQGAVRYLADEIAGLQQRGYTLEQCAETLSGVGLPITTPTLKSYLGRIKKTSKRAGNRSSTRPPPQSAAPPREGPAPEGTGKEAAPMAASAAPPPRVPAPKDRSEEARPVASRGATGEHPSAPPKSTSDEFLVTDRKKL